MSSGPSVASLQSAALLSTLVHAGPAGLGAPFVPQLPLLESALFDRSSLGVLGAPSAAALHKLCAKVNSMLEGGAGSAGAGAVECFVALRIIAAVAREAPAIVEASASSAAVAAAAASEDGSAPAQHGPSSLRPVLDSWSKTLFRLLKSLLDPRSRGTPKQGAPILPPLHPLLSLVAFETMLGLLTRIVSTWADARKECMNTTVPGLLPLLLKMITLADTYAWGQREQTKAAANAATHKPAAALAADAANSSSSNHAWPFPPPCGLERSLALLVGFLCEFKHSLRPFGPGILAACVPLLGHESEEVRAGAAEALACWSLVQSSAATASAKKKDAAAAAKADGAEDDDAEEEEEKQLSAQALQQQQSQASRIVIPEDPWSLMLQSAINTLHTKLDEMDAAGDYLPQQQLDHASIAVCTTATLALPPLPVATSVVPQQPFLRANALRNQFLGCVSLLESLLDRSLFSAMHSAATYGSQESFTIGVPIQALLALLQRVFAFDLNAHTLLQITGRALSRPSLLAILPALYEAALGLLETLCLDFMGADAARPYVHAVGEMIKEMMQRYAAFNCSAAGAGSKEEKHGLPRLVPRLYGLASRIVARFGSGALLGSFILPLLTSAQEDAERLIKVKNLQLQLNRNASSMQAFTGATLQKSMSNKEARRSSGGGAAAAAAAAGSGSKASASPDTSALFLEVHRLDLLTVAGVAALGFIHNVFDSAAAPALPQQKRIQLDRSMLSIAMAVQTGSWKVVDAYRLELYRCLSASMLTPVAASAGSVDAGMLATFSLLPYAVPVFRRAALHDDAESVRVLVGSSLRLASALVHPRALALSQRTSAFVQDASLAPMGDDQAEGAGFGEHDESSANRLGQGLVRGRDGSLYMKMAAQEDEEQQEAQEEAAEQQQQQQQAFAAPAAAAAASSSFYAAPAASSIPAAAPVAAALAGSKRSRDEQDEAQPMQLDSDEQSAVHASKRAHIDKPAPAAAAAAESAPSVALVEDDEADADAAALTVADDGPDADEGDQGSLWNL